MSRNKLSKKIYLTQRPVIREQCAYHPCFHRWKRDNPDDCSLPLRQKVLASIGSLAEPLTRRLLHMYITYYQVLSPERRERLRKMLISHGYTDKQLQNFFREEERRLQIMRLKEEAGPFDIFDEQGNLLSDAREAKKLGKIGKGKNQHGRKGTKGKGKGKKKNKHRRNKTKGKGNRKTKGKSKNTKEGKSKKTKSKKGKSQKASKKNTKGRKDKGIKGKMDSKEERDEFYYAPKKTGSLKPGWVNEKAVAFLSEIWAMLTAPVDEAFISRALKYFNIQASCILDMAKQLFDLSMPDFVPTAIESLLVNGSLNLVVWLANNTVIPAASIRDEDVNKLYSLRGTKVIVKKVKSKGAKDDKIEEIRESPRLNWDQKNFPLERRPTDVSVFEEMITDDPKTTFFQLAKWYDPRLPEFIINGPNIHPQGVIFPNEDDEEYWTLQGVQGVGLQDLKPYPIPLFYPELRPTLLTKHFQESRHNENDRWYIMSRLEFYEEKEVLWENPSTIEQFQMMFNILMKTATVQQMSMNGLIEMLSDLQEAVQSAEIDEYISEQDKMLDDKRTIILEQLFLNFFGTNFRDYNDKTPELMRMLCKRLAVHIRHLYDWTSIRLWQVQTNANAPSEMPSEEHFPPDDPKDLLLWSEWLDWLLEVAKTAKSWSSWLVDTDQELNQMGYTEPKKVILIWEREVRTIGSQWLKKGMYIKNVAEYYDSIQPKLIPVQKRPLPTKYYHEIWHDKDRDILDVEAFSASLEE